MKGFCYSNVTQLFKLLLSYMPKITCWFVRKFIFNDLRADNLIKSCCNIVESRELEATGLGEGFIPRLLGPLFSQHLLQYLECSFFV